MAVDLRLVQVDIGCAIQISSLEAPLRVEVSFTPVIRQRADREQQGQQGPLYKADTLFYVCHHGECWKRFNLFKILRFTHFKSVTPVSFYRA